MTKTTPASSPSKSQRQRFSESLESDTSTRLAICGVSNNIELLRLQQQTPSVTNKKGEDYGIFRKPKTKRDTSGNDRSFQSFGSNITAGDLSDGISRSTTQLQQQTTEECLRWPFNPHSVSPIKKHPNISPTKKEGRSRTDCSMVNLPPLEYPSEYFDVVRNATVGRPDGTYQYIGRVDRTGYPIGRQDVQKLEEDYRLTMAVIDKNVVVSDIDGTSNPLGKDQELLIIEEKNNDNYRTRKTLWAALEQSRPSSEKTKTVRIKRSVIDDSKLPSLPIPKTFLEVESKTDDPHIEQDFPENLSQILAHKADISWTSFLEENEVLARSLYEQKWTDLLLAELGSQIAVNCAEHGHLHDNLRRRYAQCFKTVTTLYHEKVKQLDSVMFCISNTWKALHKMEDDYAAREKEYTANFEKRVAQETDAIVSQSTLEKQKTLIRRVTNSIEGMKTKRSNDELFRMVADREREISFLKNINDELVSRNKEREDLKSELKGTITEKDKDDELNSINCEKVETRQTDSSQRHDKDNENKMSGKHDFSEKNDYISCKTSNRDQLGSKHNGELVSEANEVSDEESIDEEVEHNINGIPAQEYLNSTLYMARISESNNILWKKPMEDIENVAEEAAAETPPSRAPCHAFQAMLPKLLGPRLICRPCWLRRCMRAILHTAMKLCNWSQIHSIRFPELVYSWFEPSSEVVASLLHDEKLKEELFESRHNARWGLYYGVKHQSTADAEAKLFYILLDENESEDYLIFALNIIQKAELLEPKLMAKQFGPTSDPVSFSSMENLDKKIAHLDMTLTTDPSDANTDAFGVGAAQTIWIPLSVALQIIDAEFSKAKNLTLSILLDETHKLAVESSHCLPAESDLFVENKETARNSSPTKNATPSEEMDFVNKGFTGALDSSNGTSFSTGDQKICETQSFKCVDLFEWLQQVMIAYQAESHHRRARARLMFDTAATGALTNYKPWSNESVQEGDLSGNDDGKTVNFPQLLAMSRALWPTVTTEEVAAMYRDAYEIQYPPSKYRFPSASGISYWSFIMAAERQRFFSRSRYAVLNSGIQ